MSAIKILISFFVSSTLFIGCCRNPYLQNDLINGSKKNILSEEILVILKNTDKLEVLSLDPVPKGQPTGRKLYGQHVLGSTIVRDEVKKELISLLILGIGEAKNSYDCWAPRHAIRAFHDGKKLELQLCFECARIKTWLEDSEAGELIVSNLPKKLFNKILTASNVPLATENEPPTISKIIEFEE